jgi:ribosomal protein S12 methylthiotransferase accessory factor
MLDDELVLEDYLPNMTRMFGAERMENVVGTVNGDVKFYGLTPTNMQLEGLDRHLRLIESYKKLHAFRAAKASA